MSYWVIQVCGTIDQFCKVVQRWIDEGWEPQGGITAFDRLHGNPIYYQVMTRRNDDKTLPSDAGNGVQPPEVQGGGKLPK